MQLHDINVTFIGDLHGFYIHLIFGRKVIKLVIICRIESSEVNFVAFNLLLHRWGESFNLIVSEFTGDVQFYKIVKLSFIIGRRSCGIINIQNIDVIV